MTMKQQKPLEDNEETSKKFINNNQQYPVTKLTYLKFSHDETDKSPPSTKIEQTPKEMISEKTHECSQLTSINWSLELKIWLNDQ